MSIEAEIATITLSAIAIGMSIYALRRTSKIKSYADLDLLCAELLKVGIEYPRLRQPDLTRDYKNRFEGEELTRYETYAYMAWNLCETIYDRCKGTEEITWSLNILIVIVSLVVSHFAII